MEIGAAPDFWELWGWVLPFWTCCSKWCWDVLESGGWRIVEFSLQICSTQEGWQRCIKFSLKIIFQGAEPTGFLVILQIGLSINQLPLINLPLELALYTNRNLSCPNVILSYVKVCTCILECVCVCVFFFNVYQKGNVILLLSFLVPARFSAKHWVSKVWVG